MSLMSIKEKVDNEGFRLHAQCIKLPEPNGSQSICDGVAASWMIDFDDGGIVR